VARATTASPRARRSPEITEAPVVELVGSTSSSATSPCCRLDLAIYPRRTTVIIGASGSGKS